MARVINCDCGYVVRGETDEELLAGAHRHIEESHPDMIGKVSDSDLLARAEEEYGLSTPRPGWASASAPLSRSLGPAAAS